MRVLVTGLSGQVACSLVERARSRVRLEIIPAGRPELDLEVVGSAERAIASVAPDVVINAAAYTAVEQAEDEPERVFRVNADGAAEVAAASAKAGAPVIQISTDYVFDGHGNPPYTEDAPTGPLGIYGKSKLRGEELVRSVTPDHLIVRTAWVYSPFSRNFVKTMISAAGSRDCLAVVDDQRGSPTSALELAEGLLRIIDAWSETPRVGLGEIYHLVGSGVVSWCGFASAIMDECQRRGLPAAEVRPIRTEDWPTKAARPRNSALNCSKFARDFGFSMPPWHESVAVVVKRIATSR